MPRDGRIIDISYYSGTGRTSGSLLEKLKFSLWVGDLIGRKARELQLELGKVNHLNCYLTAEPPFGEVELATPSAFFHPVTIRLEPEAVTSLDRVAKDNALAQATFRALRLICEGSDANQTIIGRVERAFAEHGRDLAVAYLTKETQRYLVEVHHYLCPLRPGPLAPLFPKRRLFAELTYEDKDSGFRGTKRFLEFDGYEELHSAVGSISVKGDVVAIRPRRGHNFGVGIEVSRAELTPAG
ncbi:MAG: hypothetical protein AAGA56_11210 [Myxococcota bacterium]